MLSLICRTKISRHHLNMQIDAHYLVFILFGHNLKSKWEKWAPEESSHCSFLLQLFLLALIFVTFILIWLFFFSFHTFFSIMKAVFISWQHMWWWLLLTAGSLMPSMLTIYPAASCPFSKHNLEPRKKQQGSSCVSKWKLPTNLKKKRASSGINLTEPCSCTAALRGLRSCISGRNSSLMLRLPWFQEITWVQTCMVWIITDYK